MSKTTSEDLTLYEAICRTLRTQNLRPVTFQEWHALPKNNPAKVAGVELPGGGQIVVAALPITGN